MTGFGRAERQIPGIRISVEIRTVNNRFFDVGMKIPRELNPLETEIRDRIRNRISRGRVSLLILIERDATEDATLKIDFQRANYCYQKLQELNQTFGNSDPVTLNHLLHFSDFFTQETERSLDESLKKETFAALDSALDDLKEMRRREGEALARDLLIRVANFEASQKKVEKLAAGQPAAQMERLQERLELLVAQGPIDAGRLEQEMAVLADRLDISEECVRLKSHCQLFRQAVAGSEPAGKRLGFLLQEMNREVNTISSKSALAEISSLCVNQKEEIEQMREQIQNLE